MLVDDHKAAVLKNHKGNVVLNAGFLHLAHHYDFLPRSIASDNGLLGIAVAGVGRRFGLVFIVAKVMVHFTIK